MIYRQVVVRVGSPLWVEGARRYTCRQERLQVIQELTAAAREQVRLGLVER